MPGLRWGMEERSLPWHDVVFVVLVLVGFGLLIALARGVDRL